MGNNVREEIMDLDLNQEPLDPPHGSMRGLGSLLDDLETAHGRIEERIRQLEAVTSRARQRQRWRQGQTTPQTVNVLGEPAAANVHSEGRLLAGEVDLVAQERTVENGKFGKRDSTHLIAKALGMDTDAKKAGSDTGDFFDCNICLAMAREPILTCCGHLFCWPCFYQLSYIHSNAKECPVCKGEVTDTSIFPIYGNGSDDSTHKSKSKESGLVVPPRPHAHRIESVRQQLFNRGPFSSVIEERIQLVSNVIGAMGERTRSQDLDSVRIAAERTNFLASQYRTSQVLPATETEGIQRHHSLQVSRLLLQGAASFSSLSSALNSAMDSAERLVEDLEEYIHSRQLRRSRQQSSHVGDRDSFSSIAAVDQVESRTLDTVAEVNSMVPPSASSFRTDVVTTVVNLENHTADSVIEISPTVPPSSSSSSRRRTEGPRVSDVDNGVSREPRRRRLR